MAATEEQHERPGRALLQCERTCGFQREEKSSAGQSQEHTPVMFPLGHAQGAARARELRVAQ